MGYCVHMDVGVEIPADKQAECLAAINALFSAERLEASASGATSRGGQILSRHYAWVGVPYDAAKGFDSLKNAFRAWRYHGSFDDDNTYIVIEEFTGEKWGDDEVLYKAIAPFVETGTIYVYGEDDESWGYEFKDGKVYSKYCQKIWTTKESPL